MKIYLSYDLLNTIAAFVWIGTTANIIKGDTMFAVFLTLPNEYVV